MRPAVSESEELLSRLRAPNTGLQSFDDAFGSLKFARKDLSLTANGVPLHELDRALRRGELISMFKRLGKTTTITYADELKFRRMLDTPDLGLRDLEETFKTAKVLHPDLDVVVDAAGELSTPLTKASKQKLADMYVALTKYAEKGKVNTVVNAKNGITVVGLTAAVALGVDYYASLVRAAADRNGVYVLVRVNNKTTSYKLTQRSCINSNAPNTGMVFTGTVELDNAALYLLYVINGTDEKERATVERLLDGTLPTMATFESILKNDVLFKKIADYYYSSAYTGPRNVNDPCSLVPTAMTVPCLAWDGSASVNSLAYYNPYNLPDNMTLTCTTNSSLIETLVDAAGDMAHAIIGSNFSTRISAYVKYVIAAIVVMVLAAVARIVYVKYKAFAGRKSRGTESDESPLLEAMN